MVVNVTVNLELDHSSQRILPHEGVLCLSQHPASSIYGVITKLPLEVVIIDDFHFQAAENVKC